MKKTTLILLALVSYSVTVPMESPSYSLEAANKALIKASGSLRSPDYAKVGFPCYKKAEKALADGAQVTCTDRFGGTPLILAASNGYTDMCKLLMQHGAHPKQEPKALYEAATRGHKETCVLLIAHGADVNYVETDFSKFSVLTATAYFSNYREDAWKICEMLFADGANPNGQNQFGESCLIDAAGRFQLKFCELLIAHGARLHDQNRSGETALIAAAKKSRWQVCRLIANAQAINNQAIKTLLLCLNRLKNEEAILCPDCKCHRKPSPLSELYRQREQLLRPHLEKIYMPLKVMFAAKDNAGKNAYEHSFISFLNPERADSYKISPPSKEFADGPLPPAESSWSGSCAVQ